MQFFQWALQEGCNPINDTRHAKNLLRKMVRQRIGKIARKRRLPTDENGEPVQGGASVDQVVASIDELEFLLRNAVAPEPEIVRLAMEGHSTPQIARTLKCSRQHVRIVLRRFGERVAERMKRDMPERD
jgi:DNA-directed RNA polymerase specialized sigma24 family protein